MDEQFANYAVVLVRVGLGIGTGDRLLVRTTPDGLQLSRHVAAEAYRQGASNVDVLINDPELVRARLEEGSEEAHEELGYDALVMNRAAERADCFLRLVGDDLQATATTDPAARRAWEQRFSEATAPFARAQLGLDFPWTIAGVPGPRWARSVFPEREPADALAALWEAVLRVCRADEDEPVASWRAHVADLNRRCRWLDEQRFDALTYRGPGTALTVGLARRHRWASPASDDADRPMVANIPTEEAPTAPDRDRADGSLAITKPVVLGAEVVEGLQLTFRDGRVVEASATTGQSAVDALLDQPGADRLGEVSLVPLSSRVAREGLIWHNMLFDENDASHVALGRVIPPCLEGGTSMSAEQLVASGGNMSPVHVDVVVGGPDVMISGINTHGDQTPLIVDGEWAFAP